MRRTTILHHNWLSILSLAQQLCLESSDVIFSVQVQQAC